MISKLYKTPFIPHTLSDAVSSQTSLLSVIRRKEKNIHEKEIKAHHLPPPTPSLSLLSDQKMIGYVALMIYVEGLNWLVQDFFADSLVH